MAAGTIRAPWTSLRSSGPWLSHPREGQAWSAGPQGVFARKGPVAGHDSTACVPDLLGDFLKLNLHPNHC